MSLLPIVHGGITAGGGFTAATGGTITTDGNFKVHTFNSSGTFEVTTAGAGVVEYLVIAGVLRVAQISTVVEVVLADFAPRRILRYQLPLLA